MDGTLALTNSFYGIRGVCQPSAGGDFLGPDYGDRLPHVDITGVILIFVNDQTYPVLCHFSREPARYAKLETKLRTGHRRSKLYGAGVATT